MLKNTLQMNNRKKPLIWFAFLGVKSPFETVFTWGIKGESGTPDIGFRTVAKMQKPEKFYKSCHITPKSLRETGFFSCKPAKDRQNIFNKRILMLKIHYFDRDFSKAKNPETLLQTGIARNSGIYPELNITGKIALKAGQTTKMELV